MVGSSIEFGQCWFGSYCFGYWVIVLFYVVIVDFEWIVYLCFVFVWVGFDVFDLVCVGLEVVVCF